MYQTLAGLLGMAAALVICGFALWRGAASERWAAGAFLAAWLVSPLVEASQVMGPQWGVFWIDLAVLGVFVGLLAIWRRGWLVAAAAFQMLAVASHWAFLIDHRITMNTYRAGLAIWSLAILAAMLFGTWKSAARRRAASHEPADSGIP